MNDNKKFWQRYAKFNSRFVSAADKSYMEICNKIEPYINKENGFGVVSDEVVGSRISPLCCLVARKGE